MNLHNIRAFWGFLVWAIVLMSSATVLAQTSVQSQQATLQPVVVEGIPERPHNASISPDGDLILLPKPGQGPDAAMRLIPAGSRYQRAPISVGTGARVELDQFVEEKQSDTWAVGGSLVVTRNARVPWSSIALDKVDPKACRERMLYGGPCQRIIPLGMDRAVVLRPIFERVAGGKRVLSTRLIALVRGQEAPVGQETLPNVILGPVVRDGQGGFWVMMRRVNTAVAGYKPLRGYLHYTKTGQWKVWSDSGESVPGLEFKGRTTFLINPQSRNMTSDGRGGFLSIAKDNKLYRVSSEGLVTRFLKRPRPCASCTNLSIDTDTVTGRVMVLQSQERRGEVGQSKQTNPLKWFLFDLDGKQIDGGEVKLPPDVKPGRDLYNTVRVHTQASNTWVVAHNLVLHWIGGNWRWLASNARIQKVSVILLGKQEPKYSKADDAMVQGVLWGGVGLGIGALVLSAVQTEQEAVWSGMTSVSMLAAYGASQLVMPWLKSDTDEPHPNGCLIGGGTAMAALTGLSTWSIGSYLNPDTEDNFRGSQLLTSLAGAGAGTALAVMSSKLILRHGGSEAMAQIVLVLLSGSGSALGYVLGE